MSNDKNTQKSTAIAPVAHQAPAGFHEVDVDLPAFKAELFAQRSEGTDVEDYTGKPILGCIVECRNFGDAKDPVTGQPIVDEESGEIRQQIALIFKIEGELGVQGRDKSQPAYSAAIGSKVVVFPTVKLLQAILAEATPRGAMALATQPLSMAAKVELICNHPDGMLRFWVLPTTRTKHPTKPQFRIWNYKVQAAKPVLREGGNAANILSPSRMWETLGLSLASGGAVNAAAMPNGRPEHVLPGATA